MTLELAVTAFATLFVIIDPIGLAPLFVALTQGMSPRRRRFVALRASAVGFGLLVLFGLFGEAVLGVVGISMPAFRISGGLLLFLIAVEMLFEKRTHRREQAVEIKPDPSIFPLATPLIAGPGAMATIVLLMGQNSGDLPAQMMIFGVVLLVVLTALGLFMMGGLIERVLGQTGINVITRLLGMLLAALAVQFVLDGISDLGLFGMGG
ncbi:MarC family protein [Oceanomicrobium pacificus]|uniref:UPF0056 membrane protein n=1 Tax=Oceanomicrobium pacificus TaxID=2692916 RepID=A0A6B0TMC9_9RHOB|nr:MarC family protein [Oceanomicrobium pacificus]MXU65717.1 NAAT family transporter [Oceanomicrobium pacificus]